jgi:O-antigen/teichoic acid export membrane protein
VERFYIRSKYFVPNLLLSPNNVSNIDPVHPDLSAPESGAELDGSLTAPPTAENSQSTSSVPEANANASAGGIARNALFGYLATAIGAVTGLIVTPLLLRHLGEAQFGLWVLLLSVVGYLGLLEVGLYMTVSKRVAECLALDDQPRLKQILATAFLMYGSLGVAALLISVILALLVGHIFHLSPEAVPTARWCMLVLGVNQFLVFVLRLQPAILFGAGRLDRLTAVASITSVVVAVINVILAIRGYNIVALAVVTTFSTLLSGLLIRRMIMRYLPYLEIHPRYADREVSHELLRFGSRNATLSVAGTIAFGADALVIGLLLPVANVTHYAIAAKLVNLVKELCQKPIDVLLPAYSHSQANRDVGRQFQMWTESVSLSMAICLPFVVALWAFGDKLILAWVGPGHEESYFISVLLGVMILLQLPGHASFMILTGTERNTFLVRIYVLAAFANIMLSVLLTRQFGPVGVALGSLLTVTIVDFLILPWHVCYEFNFNVKDYLVQSLSPLLAPLVASIMVTQLFKNFGVPYNTPTTLLMLGLVIVVAWSTWGLFGINAARRRSYLRTARAAIGRFAPSAS